jgi:hypothetical protein
MNKKFRFSVAVLLAIVLVLVAANAWAAPKFNGTVPPPPDTGNNTDEDVPNTSGTGGVDCTGRKAIDMGTAEFSDEICSLEVVRVNDPEKQYPSAPDPLVFVGDTFEASTATDGTPIQVCYAYPPGFADKNAKLYKLNDKVNPPVWEEVNGAVIANGKLCATNTQGVFALIGAK